MEKQEYVNIAMNEFSSGFKYCAFTEANELSTIVIKNVLSRPKKGPR